MCVCVHSLDKSVLSVLAMCECEVLAETKSVGLVPSKAENLREKLTPGTRTCPNCVNWCFRILFEMLTNIFSNDHSID